LTVGQVPYQEGPVNFDLGQVGAKEGEIRDGESVLVLGTSRSGEVQASPLRQE
jgi:hypothetical protein